MSPSTPFSLNGGRSLILGCALLAGCGSLAPPYFRPPLPVAAH
jgi:hypothetical protein